MAPPLPADSPVPGQRRRAVGEPTPEDAGHEPPFLDLPALEERARELLPADVYDYYAGGAETETTLREAPGSWQAWRLRPRVLTGITAVPLATDLLGTPVGSPIGVAPWAYQGMAHPDGELATARGAAAAGSLMTVSTSATHALEEVAAEPPARRSGSSSTACTPPRTPTTSPAGRVRPATPRWS